MPEHLVIGVCVTDTRLGLRLSDYVTRSGSRPVVVNAHELDAHRCRGLIWDLAPMDQAAPVRVRTLRSRCPVMPVLLYVRPGPSTGPIVQQCAALPLVRLQFQVRVAQETSDIATGIRWLLDAGLEGRLTRLARALFGSLAAKPARFLALAIQRVAAGQGVSEPTVKELAAALRTTERTLEHWCLTANLPSPKRATLWIWLLYLVLAADALDRDTLGTAAQLGVDPKRLHERLQTLIPTFPTTAATPAQQLDCVLNALIAECRLPADRLPAARAAVA